MTQPTSDPILSVRNLHAQAEGTPILQGFNLEVNPGEIHAIMGRNGSGKSTLSKVLAGHPDYEVTGGEVWFREQNLLAMSPEERSLNGLFMAFQYPVEIPGVSNLDFLRVAYNAQRKHQGLEEMDAFDFEDLVEQKLDLVGMDAKFLERNLNEGFSGGEKKRNEILQMALLDPALGILDETDSGLDIDALKTVAGGVNELARPDNAIVIITHYQRLLNYVEPQVVHVMGNGRILKSGDKQLAVELEASGYEGIETESVSEVGAQ